MRSLWLWNGRGSVAFSSFMARLWLLAALALPACDAIPKDIEGTADRISRERQFDVGIIASTDSEPTEIRAFLAAVSGATGASPHFHRGATEPLLMQLDQGDLDLVVGPMATDSGWRRHVHFMPLSKAPRDPGGKTRWMAMARNGENRWIGIAHPLARQVAKQ